MFIDSHCHLNSDILYNNLKDIIKNAKKNNVDKFLSIGVDLASSKKNIEIKSKFNNVFISAGLHPNYIDDNYQEKVDQILSLFENSEIDAIGEVGLDYFRNNKFRIQQIEAFEKQIYFAKLENKPIVVHTRDAFEDTHNLIKKSNYYNFIIHCFTGSKNEARKFLDLQCYISFSGIITFKNSRTICEALKHVPLDRLLIETDSPFLSPDPLRGKVNSPENLLYVAKKVSEIKNVALDKIANITSQNFNKIFKK